MNNYNIESLNLEYKVGEVTLGYKRTKKKNTMPTIIKSSEDSARFFRSIYKPNTIGYKEYFKVLYLNYNMGVLSYTTISEGAIAQSLVDVRIIMQGALLTNAVAIILCHNHPSGNTLPSEQDKVITKSIVNAGKLLNINVLDHIILTETDYYSFNDEGLI